MSEIRMSRSSVCRTFGSVRVGRGVFVSRNGRMDK
jgi:hypothetical protein